MSSPSFPSFPSFSSFPDLDAGPNKDSSTPEHSKKQEHEKRKTREREGYRKDERRRETDGRHKEQKDHHKSQSRREHQRDSEGEKRNTHLAKTEVDVPSLRNSYFYSDRKGDRMNIQYGGLHSADVPKYRLVAGGRNILGLPKDLVVLQRFGKGLEIGPRNNRKVSGLTDSSSRALLESPPSRQIFPSVDSGKYREDDGFIKFPTRRDTQTAEDSYRSITRTKDNDESDTSAPSEGEFNSSGGDDDHPVLAAYQETLKRLDQELTAHPDSITTWMSLLQQTLSTIPITSKNATKARCEITASILSRAISAAPQNAANKELRLAYIKAGEEIWHESKLRSEWQDALKLGGIEIQMEWLEWKIRKPENGIDGVVQAAIRAMEKLGTDEDSEIAKVRIFWRVAVAIRDAGYLERAFATFQAQAELLFCPPLSIAKLSFQTQLEELEEFWESEALRIGEDGAKGWASWYSSETDKRMPHQSPVKIPTISDLDPYRQWAAQELETDRHMYIPLPSDSETSDPYSTVLFGDVRSMILNIKSTVAKRAFRMVWLSFMGLHVPGLSLATSRDLDWDDRWNLGYLTRPHYLNHIFPSTNGQRNLLTYTVAGVVIGTEREYNSPFGPVHHWSADVSGPLDFSSTDPSKPFRKGIWSIDDVQSVDENVVRRLFAVLKIDKDDTEWSILALAFEAAITHKSATKLSKLFLSTHPNSVSLWDAHAQLERMRGRLDDARKIYQTILVANSLKLQTGFMWWHWAEMEWLAGDEQATLSVVLKSVGVEGPRSVITVLRAKRLLEDYATSKGLIGRKEEESWIKLRILLELLTGDEPTETLRVFDRYLSPLEEKSSAKESLTTAFVLMIYWHGTTLKKPIPPSLLRERAHAAFEEYPNNSILLGILLESERGQGVWGRIRAILGDSGGKAKDVVRRIEEVWVAGWEKGRWLSEVERTRNGLAAAIEHERTRASSVIWKFYIQFEIRAQEPQRAKKLFFRAIGECPLVKELYLLAFGPLRSVFHVHELNALADTMAERGIRLRQGLDEVIEGVETAVEGEGEGSESSEDEIEHNARELRRLMPY
ncbi:hypothetical protein BDN70DRAFT_885209 [Pholiota conissans]|uniref:DUF1740-domain-containing protein n=1 Tax=Pholiota conissans TaxID=109636 RepID=A0A9P6CUQ7_9AGAR|nr:hypothetical protein BDN70DRAFT_885209 [Pholiota conissans]